MVHEKIELFKKKSFGEKLNATFDFVRENFRPLLKYLTYLLLPLSLVGAFGLQGFMSNYMSIISMQAAGVSPDDALIAIGIMSRLLLYVLLFMLMALLTSSLVCALIRLYEERAEGLQGITFSDIKPLLLRNMGRSLLMMLGFVLLYIVAVAILVALALLTPWTLLLTLPALIACLFPLYYWMPAYMIEDNSFFGSLAKAFRLGFPTWGGIFGVMFVIGLLVNIISTVVMLPFIIVFLVKSLLFVSEEGGDYVWIDYVGYLLSVFTLYATMVLSSLSLIAISYQYGHACDKIDGVSMDHDIDDFDTQF